MRFRDTQKFNNYNCSFSYLQSRCDCSIPQTLIRVHVELLKSANFLIDFCMRCMACNCRDPFPPLIRLFTLFVVALTFVYVSQLSLQPRGLHQTILKLYKMFTVIVDRINIVLCILDCTSVAVYYLSRLINVYCSPC